MDGEGVEYFPNRDSSLYFLLRLADDIGQGVDDFAEERFPTRIGQFGVVLFQDAEFLHLVVGAQHRK